MAWIQVRDDLPDDTRIILMAHRLKCDTERVMGCFIKLWILADKHTLDGRLGLPEAAIDEHLHMPGFVAAASAKNIDWIGIDSDGMCFIPRFHEKNGESHKARLLKAQRQGRWRSGTSTTPVDGVPSTQAPPARLPQQEQEQAKEQEKESAASKQEKSSAGDSLVACQTPNYEVLAILRKLWKSGDKPYELAAHKNATPSRVCWLADRIIREKPGRPHGFMESGITNGWEVPREWEDKFNAASGVVRKIGGAA